MISCDLAVSVSYTICNQQANSFLPNTKNDIFYKVNIPLTTISRFLSFEKKFPKIPHNTMTYDLTVSMTCAIP